jgi:hypothetical protein
MTFNHSECAILLNFGSILPHGFYLKKYGVVSFCLSLLPFQIKQTEQLHSTAVAEPPGPVASYAASTVLTEPHLKFG